MGKKGSHARSGNSNQARRRAEPGKAERMRWDTTYQNDIEADRLGRDPTVLKSEVLNWSVCSWFGHE